MNKLIIILSVLVISNVAMADSFPVLICDADLASVNNGAKTQYLIDMNTHSVYMLIEGKAPSKQRVVTIQDNRPSSGDFVTYELPWGVSLALTDQGEDPQNPWSLISETEGDGACKGR